MFQRVISEFNKLSDLGINNDDAISYLKAFKFDCELRNLSEKTVYGYFERIRCLALYLNSMNISFVEVSKQVIQEYIISLKGRVSDETINGRIRVYRLLFNFLVVEGLWNSNNPLEGIKLLKTVSKVKPVITIDDVQLVLKSLKTPVFETVRNKVMVLLFWDCMLRQNELLNLKVSDINLDNRLIKVLGKGRKERMVPMGLQTIKLLHKFLIKWRSKYAGEFLICMRNGEQVKQRHCHKIIQRLGQKQSLKLYPHLFRHSAATHYIRLGGNPAVLQRILGHSSLAITQNYLHLSNIDTVNSYDSFSPSNGLQI